MSHPGPRFQRAEEAEVLAQAIRYEHRIDEVISGEALVGRVGLTIREVPSLPPGVDGIICTGRNEVLLQPGLNRHDHGFAAAHETSEAYSPKTKDKTHEAFQNAVGAAMLIPLGLLRRSILDFGLNWTSLHLVFSNANMTTLVRRVTQAIPNAAARGWQFLDAKWQEVSEDFAAPYDALKLEREVLTAVYLKGKMTAHKSRRGWEAWAWRDNVSGFPKQGMTFLVKRQPAPHWVR